jgi:cathepsin E
MIYVCNFTLKKEFLLSGHPHIRVAIMVAASFVSTLLLALAVTGHPVEREASLVKLPFAKVVSTGLKNINIVKQDRLRLSNIRAKAGNFRGLKNREVISSSAENGAVFYIASVGVGSPATYCKRFQHLVAD